MSLVAPLSRAVLISSFGHLVIWLFGGLLFVPVHVHFAT